MTGQRSNPCCTGCQECSWRCRLCSDRDKSIKSILLFWRLWRRSLCLAMFQMVLLKMMMFFWVLALHRLIGRCQHFWETYCLHFQGWRQYDSLKRWHLPTSLHGAKTQKNIIIIILTAMRNLKSYMCYWKFHIKCKVTFAWCLLMCFIFNADVTNSGKGSVWDLSCLYM
jgi:hypothetical protein